VFACFVQIRFADENFSLLAWFSSTIHLSLSVSEVSYKPLTSHTTFLFFLLQLLHSQLLYVKPFLIEYVSTDSQQQAQQQQQCKCHTGMSQS
jgi:hypothetical protein